MLESQYRNIKHYDCSDFRITVLKMRNPDEMMYCTVLFPASCSITEALHMFSSFIFIYIVFTINLVASYRAGRLGDMVL